MPNITWFDNSDILAFPNVERAMNDPDGLLAAGGNLSVPTLSLAYRSGIFPWFDNDQPILWWSPSVRAIIDTGDIHVSKNMKKLIRQSRYSVRADTCFDTVIERCARANAHRPATWITDDMRRAYQTLFNCGVAHSIEVFSGKDDPEDNSGKSSKKSPGRLVGGLYGVFVRNCFCGESMFSTEPNTSKLALIQLARFLQAQRCEIIDCQLPTPHLASMGAVEVPRNAFIKRLTTMQDNHHLVAKQWDSLWNQTVE
ncbi:MAG: leucyl/phenylalanyl-tRNA--protein transferase [Gammaproteobacteria bacterium]|nr:MAG: leucyl/phenylalanyl-tRNA--protein transferase [Gammaproteobacteria bacterium]